HYMARDSSQEMPSGEVLSSLCARWRIKELSVFGSLARGEAGSTSDADVLITFQPDAASDLWDMVNLQDELASLFGRPVDLFVEGTIRNPVRRRAILRDKRQLYAA